MKKTILLVAITLLSVINAKSQTSFEIPKNVKLNAESDYEKYEKDIINAAKWLEETDLNKDTEKRKEVNAFVLQWISGSPTISVEINDKLGEIYGDNTQLLALFLASYTRNYLELKTKATKQTAIKAALLSMINVYKKGIDIKKSSEMEKVIKLQKENTLDNYISKNF